MFMANNSKNSKYNLDWFLGKWSGMANNQRTPANVRAYVLRDMAKYCLSGAETAAGGFASADFVGKLSARCEALRLAPSRIKPDPVKAVPVQAASPAAPGDQGNADPAGSDQAAAVKAGQADDQDTDIIGVELGLIDDSEQQQARSKRKRKPGKAKQWDLTRYPDAKPGDPGTPGIIAAMRAKAQRQAKEEAAARGIDKDAREEKSTPLGPPGP